MLVLRCQYYTILPIFHCKGVEFAYYVICISLFEDIYKLLRCVFLIVIWSKRLFYGEFCFLLGAYGYRRRYAPKLAIRSASSLRYESGS